VGHWGDFLNLYPQAEICCLGGGVALRFEFIVFITGESCYLFFFFKNLTVARPRKLVMRARFE